MSRRRATVTQADVMRTLRAVKASGLTIVRVVARPDGVAIETAEAENLPPEPVASAPDTTWSD